MPTPFAIIMENKKHRIFCGAIFKMVAPAGFEPATF